MSINSLYDTYKKDPNYVENLLRGHIKIEKLYNASKFCFEKDSSGAFKYYKNKEIEISDIDMAFSQFYKDPISHFENLSNEQKMLIPILWKFDMDFIFKNHSVLNSLILTCIKIKNEKRKIIDIIYDNDILKKWASVLEVCPPQIFFDGKLSNIQYDKILKYLNTPLEDISIIYNGKEFTTFFLDILINDNHNADDIEGFILKFENGDTYKIENIQSNVNNIKNKFNNNQVYYDTFYIILSMIDEFYSVLNFKNIKLTESGFNNRYLEFIEKTFLIFSKSDYYKQIKNENLNLYFPDYLKNKKYGFDYEMIKDENLRLFLIESYNNIILYKTFLNYMRSHKKKEIGIYDKYAVNLHNSNVNNIIDYIGKNTTTVEEFQTFNEFKNFIIFNDDVYNIKQNSINEIYDKDTIDNYDDDKKPSGITDHDNINNTNDKNKSEDKLSKNNKSTNKIEKNNINNKENSKDKKETEKTNYDDKDHPIIKIIKNIIIEKKSDDENNNENNIDVPEIASKKRNIIVVNGIFFPITNDNIIVINELYKKYKLPIYLIIKRESLKLYNIDENILTDFLNIVVENENSIKGFKIYNGYTLDDIYNVFTPSINILYYVGDETDCNDIMLFKNKKLNIFKSSSIIDQNFFIERFVKDDYNWFITNTPKYIHNYYIKIKNYFTEKMKNKKT